VPLGFKSSGSRIEETRSSRFFFCRRLTGGTAVVPKIVDCLFLLVLDMRRHDREPIEGIKEMTSQ